MQASSVASGAAPRLAGARQNVVQSPAAVASAAPGPTASAAPAVNVATRASTSGLRAAPRAPRAEVVARGDAPAPAWKAWALNGVLIALALGATLAIGVFVYRARGVPGPPLPPRNVPVSTTGNVLLLATDEAGHPLPQAVLSVDGIPGRSGVGMDGTCRLAVSAGTHTLRAVAPTAPGADPPQYHPRAATLRVPSDADGTGGATHALVSVEAWAAAIPWEALAQGVEALAGGDVTVTITYSFMNPGVYVSPEAAGRTIVLEDYGPGGVSDVDAVAFAAEVRAALAAWVGAFSGAFCPARGFGGTLSVAFEERFEPSAGAPSIFAHYAPAAAGVGDIRIGMWAQGVTSRVLAYTYGPDAAGSTLAGDMLFNADIDWKTDAAGAGVPGYSVLRTATHELGHAWGLLHSAARDDVMFPYVSPGATFAEQFPDGLASSDTLVSALLGLYAPGAAAAHAAARDAALSADVAWRS